MKQPGLLAGHKRCTAACIAMLTCLLSAGPAPGQGAKAGEVKVYEGTREILTGPFKLRGLSPQRRGGEFKPVRYPAVYIENDYLRCCVLPTVGGRLYGAYNKASKSQVFFVNPYLETHADDYEGGHPWNLGGVEVNFPYFHHGNTYNDRWQWAEVRRADGSAGVAMGFTSRPTMQRAVFRVLLRPGAARVHLEYRFENLNPYPWGLAAWIDTMHPKTMDTQFILPSPWVAQHGHNRSRTDLKPWPVRNGIDLSWQRNVPPGGDLSEFGFMPRAGFHGCYDHARDRGAVRVFDPKTLPAAKLWTQSAPAEPEQYYQHFEIWTATSAIMEDPRRQAELSAYAAADGWQQAWGIGGFVFANEDLAINLARREGGKLLSGICGTRQIAGCTVVLREGPDTFYRAAFDLDPARPWRKEIPAPAGDVVMEVLGPDGALLGRYELRADELPREQWQMPKEPRWRSGLNAAYYEEDYSTLWRRRGHFLDGAIGRYNELWKEQPKSARIMLSLARAYIKDAQVRVGSGYRQPGTEADADAARRRRNDLETAVKLLEQLVAIDPQSARAVFYLGLAREGQGKRAEAVKLYRSALKCDVPACAAGVHLARLLVPGSPAEAAELARRAAAVYPQSSRARHVLMAALIAAGKAEEALAVGGRLAGTDPADPITWRLLGDAAATAGREAQAKALADRVRRLVAADDQAAKALEGDLRWLRGD
jgi:tetratricopeptide (TPR) repeat protein